MKKAECQRTDAFELWCWRRLLRVPWTARKSRKSILKEISPGCSLEGMMLKLKLLPPIPPSLRVFSNESTLCMRWPKYWSFSFSIIASKDIPGLISFRIDWWISLQSKGLSRVFSNTTVQKHQFFGAQLSSQTISHIHT